MGVHTSTQCNVDNNVYLYVKSAPSKEEWENGCWYRNFVGDVIVGGRFFKQFSPEEAKARAKVLVKQVDEKGKSESQIERALLDARNIAFNGFKTIHKSDVNILTTSQYRNYLDKMYSGSKLDLGTREDSWLVENPIFADD